ncbi:unnamed protein product [Nippostrongylus brasiliensis]|uniref:Uncharacterized protein n=1 Tax=Nippostrongylus brasiliensis TaxID=27835 RepID=A0A0N4XSW0_NIPBR|nr:unnamed protein product [Nippostrongylus brasiliensis]
MPCNTTKLDFKKVVDGWKRMPRTSTKKSMGDEKQEKEEEEDNREAKKLWGSERAISVGNTIKRSER